MTSRLLFALAILAVAYAPAVSSSDPEDCQILADPCDSGMYVSLYRSNTPSDGACSLRTICQPAHEPPSHLSKICAISGNQFLCEAWPRGKPGEDFTYDWFATGSLSVGTPSPSSSPLQTISCNPGGGSGGFVSVVVTSPYGLSSTYFQALSCP